MVSEPQFFLLCALSCVDFIPDSPRRARRLLQLHPSHHHAGQQETDACSERTLLTSGNIAFTCIHWLGPFTWLPSRREVPSAFWATRLPAVGPGSITEEDESIESGGQAGARATLALSFTFSGEKTSSRGKTSSFPGRLGGWDLKFGPT